MITIYISNWYADPNGTNNHNKETSKITNNMYNNDFKDIAKEKENDNNNNNTKN